MNAMVKEGFDNLPMGVCYFNGEGMVRLVNRWMMRISQILIGSVVQSLDELHAALADPSRTVETLDRDRLIFRFPNGTAVGFSEREITDSDGVRYTEVIAVDVTELVVRQRELREENARLVDANRRAKRLYDNMPEIVREEETLSMKMRIHDDIGHSIIAARKALLAGESLETIRRNAAVWEDAIAFLDRSNRTPEPPDALEYAGLRAKELGIEIRLDGELAGSPEARYIFTLAIRECVTNCARHAGGTKVFVHTQTGPGSCAVTITNDGTPPSGEITEGGGLSALRRRIEKNGGVMTVRSLPRFALTVILPEKEEGVWSVS